MKKKAVSDLKNKTVAELEKLAADLSAQMQKPALELSLRRSKNTNIVRNMKKDFAQIQTVINEKHANL